MRFFFLFALLPCVSALAQTTPYHSADTLRYREVTRSLSHVELPSGPVESDLVHEATLALWFTAPDTAHAAYERLMVTSGEGTDFTQVLDTREAIGVPFVLRFPASGRVETVEAPAFPDFFREMTDLTRQFDDYFLLLPTEPLALGVTWRDTTTLVSDVAEATDIGRYVVSGDTLVGGVDAWIVTSSVARTVRSEVGGAQAGTRLLTAQDGVEHNRFVVGVSPVRLISRTRSGETAGTLTVSNGTQTATFPVRDTFTNRIDLLTEAP
jgi:hypothetical protein